MTRFGALGPLAAGLVLALCVLTQTLPAGADPSAPSGREDPGRSTALAAAGAPRPGQGGPTITVDPQAARPGEAVLVTLSGWESVAVTVAVCGNLARRGSLDCDVRSAEGMTLGAGGGNGSVQLFVTAPPAPCPCVVRAASATYDEMATAAFEVIGAPVATVVEPEDPGPLVAVSLEARRAQPGLAAAARAALGGPVAYEVTVSVRNLTDGELAGIQVAGVAASRFDDAAASFVLRPPERLAPRATWRHRVQVEVPAPSIGELRWEVVASGAGPAVPAEHHTTNTPLALLALVAVLVVDLAVIAWRFASRQRMRAVQSSALVRAVWSSVVSPVRPSRSAARG